jgi:hypothetical protein
VAGLIVLESMWNPRGRLLDEEPSVLPYLKAIRQSLAWEGAQVRLVYRRFHTTYDLGLLLREVIRKRKSFRVCYIASHGQRRRLLGLGGRSIRLETLTDYCRSGRSMGFVFGACDFLTPDTALNFLTRTGAKFVAGYQKSIPWTESMLVDSLFLSYLLGGTMKWVRTKDGERMPPLRASDNFQITHTENPQRVAAQLYRDFPLSHDITFTLFTLSRRRGRKPLLVNSFDLHLKKLTRARRLLRDLDQDNGRRERPRPPFRGR